MIEIRNETIPVEVIVKFNEQGVLIPLKLVYADDIYIIDKVYRVRFSAPLGYESMLEYPCLIRGVKRSLFYDRYKNTWYIVKKVQIQTGRFGTDTELEGA